MRTVVPVMILCYLSQAAPNQENVQRKCNMDFDGQCIGKVQFVFANNLTDKGELFVFYKDQEHEEEIISQCDWKIGDLHCQHMEAYTCELRLQKYFSISIHKERNCVTSGDFRVDAAYQQPIHCNSADYKKGANDPITHTSSTSTDTVNEVKDKTIVAGVVGAVIGCLATVIGVGIFVSTKVCRKPRKGSAGNDPTSDSVGKTPQENTTFLIDSEKNDHRNWTCVKQFRQLCFPGASASGTSAV